MARRWFALVAVTAACTGHLGWRAGTSTGAGPGTAPRERAVAGIPPGADPPPAPTGPGDPPPSTLAGMVSRAQLQSLRGKTPHDARAALRRYHHVGVVTVAPGPRFIADCPPDRVCGFDVSEVGLDVDDPITLYVNPGLDIAPPPD